MEIKKGKPSNRYDETFKLGAIKLVVEGGHSPSQVSAELGVSADTIRNWLKNQDIRLLYNKHIPKYTTEIPIMDRIGDCLTAGINLMKRYPAKAISNIVLIVKMVSGKIMLCL